MRTKFTVLPGVALLLALLVTPCRGREKFLTEPALTNHIISADLDGLARWPAEDCEKARGGRHFKNNREFGAYVTNLFVAANAWAVKRQLMDEHGQPVTRLLVFVHGGLNKFSDTAQRVRQLAPIMMEEHNTNAHYPIYLAWPSDQFSSLGEHLLGVRQGVPVGKAAGLITMPLVLATDLAKGGVGLPLTWGKQLNNGLEQLVTQHHGKPFSPIWQLATQELAKHTNAHVGDSTFKYNAKEKVERFTVAELKLPFRATVGSIGQGELAQGAWKMMRRVTSNMVFPPPDLEEEEGRAAEEEAVVAGEFFRLMALIVRAANDESLRGRSKITERRVEVTLVGHSMGTIVLNRMLTRYQHPLLVSKAIKNIVYMAAACSVSEAHESVVPFIFESGVSKRHRINFYNLTLNRVAEISESALSGFAPYGSLLEYIDHHLENPETLLDRTLGSEVNVWAGLGAFSRARAYCQFKSFDRRPGCVPSQHGDFNACPYWRSEFWNITPACKRHTIPGLVEDSVNCYPEDWNQPIVWREGKASFDSVDKSIANLDQVTTSGTISRLGIKKL